MSGCIHITIGLVLLYFLDIPNVHGQESSSSYSSLPSIEFDFFDYYDGFGDIQCSSCTCFPTQDLEVDIFCFADSVPNWFTDPTLNFDLPGHFRYLSLFETRINATVDLPANAFRRFENAEDTLDKVHFHGMSFGITDERAFDNFPLKYLLIDATTLARGNQSFWSLVTAIRSLKHSLMELHITDVHTLNQMKYGSTVDLPALENFSALTTIEFKKVPLKYLRKNTFHNLPSLKYLSFKYCPLVGVSADTFLNVPALEILQISSSQLTELPRFLYNDNLANLQALSLEDSFISNLEHFKFLRTFSRTGIRFLDLRRNRIKSVSAFALNTLNASFTRNLEALYLGNNPFHCDCDVIIFAQWLRSVENKVDVKFESNLTRIEEIFGRDAHCIPRAHCSDFHKESRLQNSIPQCASPKYQEGSSLLSLNSEICKPIEPRLARVRDGFGDSYRGGYNSSFQRQRLVVLGLGTIFVFMILLVLLVVPIKSCARILQTFKSHPFLFDVYLSHHNDNIQLVIDKFIPRLEEHPNNLKLRLEFLGLPAGTDPTDLLNEVFHTSRITLFLIDDAFVNSDKCMLELNIACSSLLTDGHPEHTKQKGLVFLFLDDTSAAVLPKKLGRVRHKITYLRWDKDVEDNTDAEERQWQQLEATLRKMTSDGHLGDICQV